MRKTENIEEKLREKTTIDPVTSCWLFTGCKTKNGYGSIRYKYRMIYVHRLAAHIYHGLDLEDSKNNQALHKENCPNRNCWNPDHLYIGNNQQNMNDRMTFGNSLHQNVLKKYCKNGHEFTEENTYIRPSDGNRECWICKRERRIQ